MCVREPAGPSTVPTRDIVSPLGFDPKLRLSGWRYAREDYCFGAEGSGRERTGQPMLIGFSYAPRESRILAATWSGSSIQTACPASGISSNRLRGTRAAAALP